MQVNIAGTDRVGIDWVIHKNFSSEHELERYLEQLEREGNDVFSVTKLRRPFRKPPKRKVPEKVWIGISEE